MAPNLPTTYEEIKYNLELSDKEAELAINALISQGVVYRIEGSIGDDDYFTLYGAIKYLINLIKEEL